MNYPFFFIPSTQSLNNPALKFSPVARIDVKHFLANVEIQCQIGPHMGKKSILVAFLSPKKSRIHDLVLSWRTGQIVVSRQHLLVWLRVLIVLHPGNLDGGSVKERIQSTEHCWFGCRRPRGRGRVGVAPCPESGIESPGRL